MYNRDICEPFGYTMCETLDRGIPAIVQNINGPSEIVNDVLDNIYILYNEFKKQINNLIKISKKLIKSN